MRCLLPSLLVLEVRRFCSPAGCAFLGCGYEAEVAGAKDRKVGTTRSSVSGAAVCVWRPGWLDALDEEVILAA